jgi:tRNA modification GTPase
MTETIFAPATGGVRAAVAVLRLSGPGTRQIIVEMAGALPASRRASLRTLRAACGEILDRGLVLWMPAPASYTGEDSAELHLHGGRAVVGAVTNALLTAGARPAEPGEFTRRGFLNGRMDLLEAEAVADLVAAETDGQRRQALQQLEGAQSSLLAGWAERLRRILAWQEALIDFPDEDLPVEVEAALMADISRLAAELEGASLAVANGMRVRDGITVAIAGPPNVGKSSLLNRLARREVAITDAAPGTTRDVLEVWLELAGVPVTLIDTAGLRETDDPVEAEGVRRAKLRMAQADLVMHVCEAGRAPCQGAEGAGLLVANKNDLAAAQPGWIGVSAKTGDGLDKLEHALGEKAVLGMVQRCRRRPAVCAKRRLRIWWNCAVRHCVSPCARWGV